MSEKLKFLHIDTSYDLQTKVCLYLDGKIDEIIFKENRGHIKALVPMIKQILERNNLDKKNLDFISVVEGPGSWTGLRIGISTVKVMCMALDIKLITLNNFDLIDFFNKNEKSISLIKCTSVNYYFRIKNNSIREGIMSEIEINEKFPDLEKTYLSNFSFQDFKEILIRKFKNNEFVDIDTIEPFYLSEGNILSNYKVAKK